MKSMSASQLGKNRYRVRARRSSKKVLRVAGSNDDVGYRAVVIGFVAALVLQWEEIAITQAIDRSRPPWRQLDLASCLQLEQQAPGSHILEPAGPVAPVPSRTKFTGKPCPVRVGMGSQPISNQRDILRAKRAPLNDQGSVHWANQYPVTKSESGKNEKISRPHLERVTKGENPTAHYAASRSPGSK